MSERGKRAAVVLAVILVLAIIIAVGVYFLRGQDKTEYEGTLVQYEQYYC